MDYGPEIAGSQSVCPHCNRALTLPNETLPVVVDRDLVPQRQSTRRMPAPTIIERKMVELVAMVFGVLGSSILFAGVFCPIATLPIVGGVDYFRNGRGDGVIVLLLALASLVFVFTRLFLALWFTGTAALCVIGYTFFNMMRAINEAQKNLKEELANNPFAPLAEAAMASFGFSWGFPILVIGAALILGAAALGTRNLVASAGRRSRRRW